MFAFQSVNRTSRLMSSDPGNLDEDKVNRRSLILLGENMAHLQAIFVGHLRLWDCHHVIGFPCHAPIGPFRLIQFT